MWAHAERLDRFGRQLIQYSVDTCPGHSGAPVWLDADGPAKVIAIHTRGPRPSAHGPWGCRPGAPLAPAGHFNAGVRVTETMRQAIDAAVRGLGPLTRVGTDPEG
jgi:glutamyl endopeptidase